MLNNDKTLKEAINHGILTVSEVDDIFKMTRRKLIEKHIHMQSIAVLTAE